MSPERDFRVRDASTEAWTRQVSRVPTLLPGDIISTGTPSGVGPIQPGDVAEVEVEGVGTLANPATEG